MKSIMITGGYGFVGVHLCNYLLKKGYKVILVDVDDKYNRGQYIFNDYKDNLQIVLSNLTTELPEGKFSNDIDIIVHLAALPHVDYSYYLPNKTINNNIMALQNVLKFANKRKIKVIHVSSVEVYGGQYCAQYDETSQMTPCSIYGYSKQACENLMNYYINKNETDGFIIRLTNVYGPFQLPDRIIPRNICRLLEGLTLDVTSDFLRDFIYVEDLVEIIELLFSNGKRGETYNISTGKSTNIKDIVRQMCKLCLYDSIREFDFTQTNDIRGRYLYINNDKICSLYNTFTGVDDGIEKTITWYKNNHTWFNQFKKSYTCLRNNESFIIDILKNKL